MKSKAVHPLLPLISEGEHEQLDFKFEISDARKIARTLSAFSNTSGGRLLIGVKDNGRISGIRSDEEYYMLESAALLYSRPEVRFASKQHSIEGKSVLEIEIAEAENKPVYARDEKGRWMAYVRVADENMLASIVQLKLWESSIETKDSLLEMTRNERILLKSLGDSVLKTLAEMQKDTGIKRWELIEILTKLLRFDVLFIRYSGGEARFGIKEAPGE